MRSEGVQCGGGRERADQRGILSFWQVLLDRGGGVGIRRQGALEEKASLGLVLESRCVNLCDIHEEMLRGGTDVS